MVKSRMTHMMIRVFDLERSLKFYDGALGFKEVRRRDFPDGKFTLVYLGDGQSDYELELTYNYDPEVPYDLGTGYGHQAVYVDDLEATRDEHIKLGIWVGELKCLPDDDEPNYYFIEDPDGYRIEIIKSGSL